MGWKIIKNAEAKKIAKANNWDCDQTEDFMTSVYWFNLEHDADVNLTSKEKTAVAIYLISKEVYEQSCGTGQTKDARYICSIVDDLMGMDFGTCLNIARNENARHGRFLITELNMGLDHLTLTDNNPYFKVSITAS